MKPHGRLVGEFVLVVLGVLFALTVDAWISERNDDKLREEYRGRLADDIRSDLANLDNRIYFFSAIESFGLQTLERLEANDAGSLQAVVEAFYAAENYRYEIVDSTYRDLQSTGNLRLFDDIELRTALAAYYVMTNVGEAGSLDERYRSIVRGIIPWHIQDAIRTHCPTTDDADWPTRFPVCTLPGISDDEARAVFERIRRYPRIFEILTYRVSQVGVTVFLYSAQRQAADSLLTRLDSTR